jgi:hypothetical protein
MADNGNQLNPSELQVNYIKSNLFRVVHADGMMSNTTPSGDLFVGFYTERYPLPDSLSFEIDGKGEIQNEIIEKRVTHSPGLMREVEFGLVVDVEMAKVLVLSLSTLIHRIEAGEIEAEDENIKQ